MDLKQAKTILENYRTGNCSPEEIQMVEQWYAQLVETGEWEWSEGEKEQLEQMMEARLLQQIRSADQPQHHPVRFLRTARWWAAASVIFVLAIGAYFMFHSRSDKNHSVVISQSQRFKNDILPARQQVILTLSDGSKKVLDDISNGSVTLQGTSKAIKKDGSISYTPARGEGEVVYNTITTEKGRIFHLQLSDGTEVWLDALSSIRFPTSFPGAERVVEITGQAYFEVAHNTKQSFKVKGGGQMVEVLGTHFNINSFNSQAIQTTLLEGSLRVLSSTNPSAFDKEPHSIVMRPGQQSIFTTRDSRLTAHELQDMDGVMAWKSGRFRFDGSSVDEMVDQLSRWYNIEVQYKDKITETFVADIKRDLPLSKLLELLEMTKQIKFVIDGNKVTVMKW
ncbi:MAG: hypothetical protein BGO55_18535 [Sphingobacteriales bacterium 50-39]|nr:FecR domain-containing protein [Sphingobacteriales bacterium]OJW55057.1 MAG: hypothetical protein BGO55_18535 [Sphingobacteriales bacterium 50-39]